MPANPIPTATDRPVPEENTTKIPPSPQSHNGRRIEPLVVFKHQGPAISLDSISNTLSTLGKHASTGLSSLSAVAASTRAALSQPAPSQQQQHQHHHHDHQQAQQQTPNSPAQDDFTNVHPPLGTSPSPIFSAMGGDSQSHVHENVFSGNSTTNAQPSAPQADATSPTSSLEHISWTAWDTLGDTDALLVAYPSGGLQIYVKSDDQLVEVLNFQHLLLPGDRVAGRVLCAKLYQPDADSPLSLLAITQTASADPSLTLSSCNLDSQFVVKTTTLPVVTSKNQATLLPPPAMQASLQLTDRHLVVAQSNPPAIHILDPMTWKPIGPAILDVTSSSEAQQLAPTFHLRGRILAYASTSKPASHNVITPTATTNTHSRKPSTTHQSFNAIETGAQATDMAKRLSQGVRTGVKSFGDWGVSALASYGYGASASSASTQHEISSNGSPYIQSTPHTPSPAIEPTSSKTSSKTSSATSNLQPLPSTALLSPARSVKLLDLGSPTQSMSTIAHFRALTGASHTAHNIACVRLNSNGSMVFVSDCSGHTFNLYDVRPRPRASTRADSDASTAPTRHRCKLLRGMTTAHVCDAKWSSSEQWLGVLTSAGTVHVYYLGPPALSLPPGTTLSSFTRTPRPVLNSVVNALAASQADLHPPEPDTIASKTSLAHPSFEFLPHNTHSAGAMPSSPKAEGSSTASPARGLDVLCMHPSSGQVTLNRVATVTHSLRDSLTASAGAATTRISGLTAMMKKVGAAKGLHTGSDPSSGSGHAVSQSSTSAGPSRLTSTAFGPQGEQRTPTGACLPVAIWSGLARSNDAPEVRPGLDKSLTSGAPKPATTSSTVQTPTRGWVSLAEIETYDRRPRALPTPIYLSHQVRFHVFAGSDADAPLRLEPVYMDVPRSKSSHRVLSTRRAVKVSRGAKAARQGNDNEEEEEDQDDCFDVSLAGAIRAPGFDTVDLSRSPPSSRIPMFPQGQPARTPSWRTNVAQRVSIPIRSAVGAAAAGGRVVNGMRKTSGGAVGGGDHIYGSSGSGREPISLSFDEDISHDKFIFDDARNAAPSPNGLERGSGDSAATTRFSMSKSPLSTGGISPFEDSSRSRGKERGGKSGRAVSCESGSGSRSSGDTPPTGPSEDGDTDGYDDEGVWTAARGMQEDVEGDQLGWDSFADAEFGGGGEKQGVEKAKRTKGHGAVKEQIVSKDTPEHSDADFIVGGQVLEGVTDNAQQSSQSAESRSASSKSSVGSGSGSSSASNGTVTNTPARTSSSQVDATRRPSLVASTSSSTPAPRGFSFGDSSAKKAVDVGLGTKSSGGDSAAGGKMAFTIPSTPSKTTPAFVPAATSKASNTFAFLTNAPSATNPASTSKSSTSSMLSNSQSTGSSTGSQASTVKSPKSSTTTSSTGSSNVPSTTSFPFARTTATPTSSTMRTTKTSTSSSSSSSATGTRSTSSSSATKGSK